MYVKDHIRLLSRADFRVWYGCARKSFALFTDRAELAAECCERDRQAERFANAIWETLKEFRPAFNKGRLSHPYITPYLP